MNQVQTASSSLKTRLHAHLSLKLALALGLNLFAFVPYFSLQRHIFFPVTVMTESAFDVWFSFAPEAVWIYLSLFLLMPVAPMQMETRNQLRRYACAVIVMSVIADFIFLFWPTAVARGGDEGANIAYRSLVALDMPLNAFPSLHAAMAVFSALCCEQVYVRVRHPWFWRIAIWTWVLSIVWAMLSTKQHVALDAIGGIVLGLTTYGFAFCNQTIVGNQASLKTIRREGWTI